MSKTSVVTMKKDRKGEWRIHVTDGSNGKTLFASSEGYKNRRDAMRNMERVAGVLSLACISHWGQRGNAEFEINA